jgi:hypothetical protein
MELIVTETYVDPRARVTAQCEHADMLHLPPTEPQPDVLIGCSVYTEEGEYRVYTREAVYHACSSPEQTAMTSEASSWKQKLSLPSPFKNGHNGRKRPADMMTSTPSLQQSPCTPKTFFSASYFYRPLLTQKNAYVGKPDVSGRQPEPADAYFALPEPALFVPATRVALAETQTAASGPAHGMIDVSVPQEERPAKMPRLASFLSAPHVIPKLRKFCFLLFWMSCIYFKRREEGKQSMTAWRDAPLSGDRLGTSATSEATSW